MDATQLVIWRSELSERTRETNRRSYVTDVFRRQSKPRPGSIAIAFQQDDDGSLVAVGLGIASRPTGVADGKVRTRFDSWCPLEPPVGLDEINHLITGGTQVHVPEPLDTTMFQGSAREAILRAVAQLRPEVAEWLSGLSDEAFVEEEFRQIRDEARDAIILAADIADVDLPPDAFRHVDYAPDTDSLLDIVVSAAYVSDLEEDLIPQELRRFDEKSEVSQVSASCSVFTDHDDGHKLVVFNVNKKPFEIELGVDLVYWDKTNDTFTLIQYKRLERVSADPSASRFKHDWVYLREQELRKQLKLMPIFSSPATKSADWRLTPSPFWFKFVNGDAGRDNDKLVLTGMYVPAEYLRVAVDDSSLRSGPKGGFRLGYANTKYVTKQTFVELLRRGLIGTDSEHSRDLHVVIRDLSKTGRQTLIAVKEKWVREAATAESQKLPF
ncbi:hypothetical protein [Isoptericola sp. NPDC019571]|uniref:hypothetical protein n=1 Tax=Isoptericola sp. NPDC019571 TaxID=3364008 RepID=UPI0037B1DA5E